MKEIEVTGLEFADNPHRHKTTDGKYHIVAIHQADFAKMEIYGVMEGWGNNDGDILVARPKAAAPAVGSPAPPV